MEGSAAFLDAVEPVVHQGVEDRLLVDRQAVPGAVQDDEGRSRKFGGQPPGIAVAGANQLTGQAEAGYKVGIYAPAAASLTPIARLQATTVNQAGFTEYNASSLNLSVAQQTTNSLRSVLGVELDGAVDAGWRDKLALQFRLGWGHEYANTNRPVSASFAGAPASGFTVYGAPPQRDGAVIGLAADTAIAEQVSLYLRYDGLVGGGTDNHVLSAGLRMTW